MRNTSNITLPQSIVAMIGAVTASVFVLGLTTATGPTAPTHAAAPIA